MKIRGYLTAVVLVTMITGTAELAYPQATEAVAARVLTVKCAALLKKRASGTVTPLRDPQDVGLGLAAGTQVQCSGAGYLEVFVPEGTKKITASQGWLVIKPVPATPPYPEIAEELSKYGVPGATRGQTSSSSILWPSDNSAILPEHFVIRWTPMPARISLSVMSDTKDATLWGPTEIDGDKGSFKSAAVSAVLSNYKAKHGNVKLVLTLSHANANDWEEVHFSILAGQQEQELNSQLDFWAKHTEGIALHLGRAYAFQRHKLFAEAAEEYDSALNSAPTSNYLLEEAIQANRLAGQPSLVKKLQVRMTSER